MKRNFLIAAFGFFIGFSFCAMGFVCQSNNKSKTIENTTVQKRDINTVKEAHVNELMALKGVVGVYVGVLDNGTPCIVVMVVKKTSEIEQKIPKQLEGHPVRIEESGEIKPMK